MKFSYAASAILGALAAASGADAASFNRIATWYVCSQIDPTCNSKCRANCNCMWRKIRMR